MKLISLALVLTILFLPYLILVPQFGFQSTIDLEELFAVIRFTFFESFFSAFFSVIIGVLLGVSLSTWRASRRFKKFALFLMLPSFMPTVFVVLASLNVASALKLDLSGHWGIVILHVLINFGLVAVLYSEIIHKKMNTSNKIAAAYSLSGSNYFLKILLPQTQRDIVFLFAVVFLYSFSSFSIPLIISGVATMTTEMLIYEKLVVYNDIDSAIFISIFQFLFLSLFLYLTLKTKSVEFSITKNFSFFNNKNKFVFSGIAINLVLFVGLFVQLDGSSFAYLLNFNKFELLWNSLVLGLGSGIFVFIFSTFIFSLLPNEFFKKILFIYSSPSTVLVCLAFVIFGIAHLDQPYFWMLIAYFILFFPALFKLFANSSVEKIEEQTHLAEVYGLNKMSRFKNINFPNSFKFSLLAAFVSAIWVIGDYSVASIFLNQTRTLALEAKVLMKFYKLNEATMVVLMFVFIYSALFLFYKGIVSAFDRKY